MSRRFDQGEGKVRNVARVGAPHESKPCGAFFLRCADGDRVHRRQRCNGVAACRRLLEPAEARRASGPDAVLRSRFSRGVRTAHRARARSDGAAAAAHRHRRLSVCRGERQHRRAPLLDEFRCDRRLSRRMASLFGKYQNWPMHDNMSCRSNSGWNVLDPVKGIPPGDWCGARNQPASGDCHDAWQSVSFSTFQAFQIKDGTCAPL